MYSGTRLLDALSQQHQRRSTAALFKSGDFDLLWRSKIGSTPHPDTETIVAAGEPCGAWRSVEIKSGKEGKLRPSRPEDKRNVGENNQVWPELPLYGYIPAASIRGVVRAWAMQHQTQLAADVNRLLGYQTPTEIFPGKIEFLDAFPLEPTKLSLDIVNPQQNFQVFHEGQSTPLSLYTLGDGSNRPISVRIGIRGNAQATAADVEQVWEWVQQALSLQGIGSRRASGYGTVQAPGYKASEGLPGLPEGYVSKQLKFVLSSQGNAGPDMQQVELRPAHWRGWLRSWLLRFFLGVMSVADAKYTVAELMGTLEDSADKSGRKGTVSLQMTACRDWGKRSAGDNFQCFYRWQGSIRLVAPRDTMLNVLLPVIRMAIQVGGVGKGWRRPLHRFVMSNNNKDAARGCLVVMTEKRKLKGQEKLSDVSLGTSLTADNWQQVYAKWQAAVKEQWPDRYRDNLKPANAEVFSPQTCAVYVVPGPIDKPIDTDDLAWERGKTTATHGDGLKLIYRSPYKYEPKVGGKAGKGEAHCSWVSIRRVEKPDECQEVVCLFLGAGDPLRTQFLKELAQIPEAQYIFGKKP